MRRHLVEDTAITVTRGICRFKVRVFRWVRGKGKPSAIWTPAEMDKIRKAMGNSR